MVQICLLREMTVASPLLLETNLRTYGSWQSDRKILRFILRSLTMEQTGIASLAVLQVMAGGGRRELCCVLYPSE